MKKIIIPIIFIVVIMTYILMKCLPNEQTRVKHDLKAFAAAVEQENKHAALFYIDEAYTDNHTNDFERLTVNIDNLFDLADSIQINMTGLKIIIDSTNRHNVIFASCSLGLKIFARYQGDRALVFGGLVKPNPVRAYFKKTGEHYRVYYAVY
ncbi:MAG: hypothetical protein WBB37_03030 [bacterium]